MLSCSSNDAYYKEPVRDWLDQNLHNPSSYESVSYEVVDSSQKLSEYLPSVHDQYLTFETAHDVNIEVVPEIVSELYGKFNENKLEKAIALQSKLSKKHWYLTDVQRIIALHDSLNIVVKELIDSSNRYQKQKLKMLTAQYEVSKERFYNEKERLSAKLDPLGLSLDNIKNHMNEGLIIYHKYRANNTKGNKVLNHRVFILDKTKTKVKATEKI